MKKCISCKDRDITKMKKGFPVNAMYNEDVIYFRL